MQYEDLCPACRSAPAPEVTPTADPHGNWFSCGTWSDGEITIVTPECVKRQAAIAWVMGEDLDVTPATELH